MEDSIMEKDSEFITNQEAAHLLKVSMPVLKGYRDKGLPYYRAGKKILYRKAEIQQAIKKNGRAR
jgi:excisionase family DNA binding protein